MKTVEDLIYQYHEKKERRWPARLGASQIGQKCGRKLFYSFNQVAKEKIEGRVLRLFEVGHREEEVMIDELKQAGMEVWDKDEDGKQFEATACDGYFIFKADGVVKGVPEAPKTPHLLELKTMNDKNFKRLKVGGIEKEKPVYYAQVQVGMRLLKLKRALILVTNKNDSELYSERIHFNNEHADKLLERAQRIILATTPPPRISDNSDWWECRFCAYKEICHFGKVPLRRCRTCCFCEKAGDGRWGCWMVAQTRAAVEGKDMRAFEEEVEKLDARKMNGCKHYVPMPWVDGGKEAEAWIEKTSRSSLKTQ